MANKGYFYLLCSAAIWGGAIVALSIGVGHSGPFTLQAAQCSIGALVLLPIIIIRRRKKCVLNEDYSIHHLLIRGGVCGIALTFASCIQQYGMMHTTVAKTGFITSLYIVIVPILMIFKRRPPLFKHWICVGIATLGLYYLSMPSIEKISLGDALVLISAFCYAIQIILIEQYSKNISAIEFSFIQFLSSAIISFCLAVIVEHPKLLIFSKIIIPVLYAGILSCGVANTLQVIGLQKVNPVIATIIMSLESVFALLGGILILKQIPAFHEIIGCILILFAVIFTQLEL